MLGHLARCPTRGQAKLHNEYTQNIEALNTHNGGQTAGLAQPGRTLSRTASA